MTGDDLMYVSAISEGSFFRGPVLELGGGYGGVTWTSCSPRASLEATDLSRTAPGVDLVADFESGEGLQDVIAAGPFGTVLVLNVLEHTFNPIAVLDNALSGHQWGSPGRCGSSDLGPFTTTRSTAIAFFPIGFDVSPRLADCRCWMRHSSTLGMAASRPSGLRTIRTTSRRLIPVNPIHRLYSRAVHKVFNTSTSRNVATFARRPGRCFREGLSTRENPLSCKEHTPKPPLL